MKERSLQNSIKSNFAETSLFYIRENESKRSKISKRNFSHLSEHAIPPVSNRFLLSNDLSRIVCVFNKRTTAFDFTRGFRFTRTEKRRPRKSGKELAGSRRRLRRRYLNCRFCLLFPAFVGSQGSTLATGVQSHRSRGKVGFASTLFQPNHSSLSPSSLPPRLQNFLFTLTFTEARPVVYDRLRSFVFSHAVERSTSERPWPSTLIAIPSSRTNFREVVSGD